MYVVHTVCNHRSVTTGNLSDTGGDVGWDVDHITHTYTNAVTADWSAHYRSTDYACQFPCDNLHVTLTSMTIQEAMIP